MSQELKQDLPVDASTELLEQDFESVADYHRLAARHFSAAADHHLAAAAADDEGDHEATGRHAHLAYRHQLHGVQYAEVAVLDNDELDDEHDELEDDHAQ
jgi:hypothetical protein